MCVCAHVCGWLWKPEEGIGSYGREYEYIGPHTISENCHMGGWWTYWPTCQAFSYWWVMSMSSMSVYGHVFPHVMYQLSHMEDVYGHVDPEAISEINPVGVVWTCWIIRHFWSLSYGWVYVFGLYSIYKPSYMGAGVGILAHMPFLAFVRWGCACTCPTWNFWAWWYGGGELFGHIRLHAISKPGDMREGHFCNQSYGSYPSMLVHKLFLRSDLWVGVWAFLLMCHLHACLHGCVYGNLDHAAFLRHSYVWLYGHFGLQASSEMDQMEECTGVFAYMPFPNQVI